MHVIGNLGRSMERTSSGKKDFFFVHCILLHQFHLQIWNLKSNVKCIVISDRRNEEEKTSFMRNNEKFMQDKIQDMIKAE